MPYFQRKPTEGMVDPFRARAPIPGMPSRGPSAIPRASVPGVQISQLQAQANALSERLASFDVPRQELTPRVSPYENISGFVPCSSTPGVTVESAPVLSPPGPVGPGGTAQTVIALVNDDEQPARIAFYSTSLVGDNGAHIAADGISFQPRELTLSPGASGEVVVRVVVPMRTPGGVYSGLIRASQIVHLHAVLVVQVDAP